MAKQLVHGIMRDLDEEQRAYARRSKAIAGAAASLRQDEIARTCARYELESDEFQTREQKAATIIARSRRTK